MRSILVFLCLSYILATMCDQVDAQGKADKPQVGHEKPVDLLKQPGLKNFIDDLAKMIETLGRGDINAVVARVGKLGISTPNPQDRQRLEAALSGLRKLPPQKFERLEVTSVKSLSTRLHVFSFIAHGKYRPFFFLIAVDQYQERWRMIHIHFSNEQKNVLGQAPALQDGKPFLSYDLLPDVVAKID